MADISFTKVDLPYGWLGNMAPYPVKFNGQMFRTTEALFQALRFDSIEIRELIRLEPSPMSAKMKAKKYKDLFVVNPMSEQDVENMKFCLRLKFENPELKIKLLKTGEHKIYEDIGTRRGIRHEFWGAYRKANENGQFEWIGQNKMGNLLMEIRSELMLKTPI
jgi:predicted NAD-dependent protein-ADP-ribosyltransferase YbiA (DUF1768 family)